MSIYSLGERRVEFIGEDWYIAPGAIVIGSVVIHARASVWFNVVIRGDNDRIVLGERCNVQDGAVLHVDPGVPLTIGSGASIGHKVMLHGCTIGEGSLIGINSTILNRAVIGPRSIVGAGSVVPEGKSFPERVLLLGAPARVVREIRDDEIAWMEGNAESYVQRAREYRSALIPQAVRESVSIRA